MFEAWTPWTETMSRTSIAHQIQGPTHCVSHCARPVVFRENFPHLQISVLPICQADMSPQVLGSHTLYMQAFDSWDSWKNFPQVAWIAWGNLHVLSHVSDLFHVYFVWLCHMSCHMCHKSGHTSCHLYSLPPWHQGHSAEATHLDKSCKEILNIDMVN